MGIFGLSQGEMQARVGRLEREVRELRAQLAAVASAQGINLAHDDLVSEHRVGLPSQAREFLDRGQKIAAIKAYREATGAGLREAKEAIESAERGGPSW